MRLAVLNPSRLGLLCTSSSGQYSTNLLFFNIIGGKPHTVYGWMSEPQIYTFCVTSFIQMQGKPHLKRLCPGWLRELPMKVSPADETGIALPERGKASAKLPPSRGYDGGAEMEEKREPVARSVRGGHVKIL
ncbi:MAG: hypothetical protein NO515_07210 [Candidatus Methanomethylicia archaeon]|nr:hypothetical protein [Candidatus Methanomethylicia archaeon]